MSTLHYFQRYSSEENWLTNSTLLLLQHFYLYSPIKFQLYLNNLDDQLELKVGPVFLQQIKTESSIPDGSIYQQPFEILIEAKPHGNLSLKQLEGHISGINDNSINILLILTKNEFKDDKIEVITKRLKKEKKRLKLIFTTYQEIYDTIIDLLSDNDTEMIELLDDYAALCQERNLFHTAPYTMLGVSCSKSLE